MAGVWQVFEHVCVAGVGKSGVWADIKAGVGRYVVGVGRCEVTYGVRCKGRSVADVGRCVAGVKGSVCTGR